VSLLAADAAGNRTRQFRRTTRLVR
jgi:hypothetical protein